MSVAGRNWGDAEIDGATLVMKQGSKPVFQVPLPDVSQVSQFNHRQPAWWDA